VIGVGVVVIGAAFGRDIISASGPARSSHPGRSSHPSLASSTASSLTSISAVIRVNQVGYTIDGPKRAYLMSRAIVPPGTFAVIGSTSTAQFSGNIGSDLGAWGRFRHVYAMDFDALSGAGTYIITVGLQSSVISSPAFAVDTASNIFSTPLANALSFYQNERDGQDFIPSALRTAPGHLSDVTATAYKTPKMNGNGIFSGSLKPTGAVIDASGGWWDAGDYLKFVQTHSYAVALLLTGVRDFPEQMGPGSASSDFTAESEFGLNWLLRMWDDTNAILYYQVGVGEANSRFVGDHDIWRLPQVDDDMGGTDPTFKYIRNRPVFIAGKAGSPISPNLAGRMAADFALGFQVFQTSQPDLAARCLVAAEHIFDLADTKHTGKLLTVAPFDFYPETEWRDDLELGATELYFAVNGAGGNLPSGLPHSDAAFYLAAAAQWANAYITGPNDDADTLNLYDVSGLAHFELYRAMALAGNPTGLAVGQSGLLADIKRQLDGAVSVSAGDPFGYGTAWDQSDSATRGTALSIVANEYDFLTGGSAYASFAARWLDAVLGANAWGTSFIVGDGSVFPFCMQHQVSNIVGSTNGTPPILKGALVEGPNSAGSTGLVDGMATCPPDGEDVFAQFNGNGAVYVDNVQSFATVEPAIDLTSPSPLAFAWRISGGPAAILSPRSTVVRIKTPMPVASASSSH
jgi:endoglucanase